MAADQLPPTINGPERAVDGDAVTVGATTTPLGTLPLQDRYHAGYQLLEEIGRGGMGVVFKARQVTLNRIVALKMILSGPFAANQELTRFRAEAEAIAQLQHPNIVQIYEVNEWRAGDGNPGSPFFSLEYVEGGSLADRIRGTPWASLPAAELVRTLALAMHRAHQQGIIHRDLKPGNILLTSDGVPKITDFGLAKRVLRTEAPPTLGSSEPNASTLPGQILGTPSYMAPEQAESRWTDIGPATDVYALGAILYELLTGRPPFKAETPLDTIMHVLSAQPAPPRLLNSKVDRDLETICLKCLEKDPRLRYPTAQALANDLERYQHGDAIEASSVNLLSRLTRALEHKDHAAEFRSWGTMLLCFAAIIFVGHAITFVSMAFHGPEWFDWVARGAQFGLSALIFLRYRPHTVLPTTAAERQLWSIWIGYLLAYFCTVLMTRLLVREEIIGRGAEGAERWKQLLIYPISAMLSGMAVFTMGSNYWNRYYLFGMAFFVLALLMPFHLQWAPLELGTLWAVCLVAIGLHLRRLGREQANPPEASSAAPRV